VRGQQQQCHHRQLDAEIHLEIIEPVNVAEHAVSHQRGQPFGLAPPAGVGDLEGVEQTPDDFRCRLDVAAGVLVTEILERAPPKLLFVDGVPMLLPRGFEACEQQRTQCPGFVGPQRGRFDGQEHGGPQRRARLSTPFGSACR